MKLHFQSDPYWADMLCNWAAARDDVASIWLFGSRVTGVRRTKDKPLCTPDLDIAIEAKDQSAPDLPVFDAIIEIRDQFRPVHADFNSYDPNGDAELDRWVSDTGKRIWPDG